MPIKLTSREYRIIGISVAVAIASLAIGVKYFWRAFPEAAIEFRVDRTDSEPIARKFLSARKLNLQGYRHAARFGFDDETKVYLERTQGLERMNGLTRGPVRLWRWSHRWFKPQQKEEYRIDVTPAGEVVGFDHDLLESAPGANLEPARARELAESFLREVVKRDLSDLEFVETDTEKRPARTDHSFTWKQKSVDLGEGSLRIMVDVDGDQVTGYREFVKIPEKWSRDYQKLRSQNNLAQTVDEVFFFLLSGAMLIILVLRLRDRDVPGGMSLAFGLVATGLFFLGQLNNFSLAEFGYRTTDPYSSFSAGYFLRSVLASLGVGVWIFFLVAGSEPVYRENYPGLISLRRYLTWQGLRSRSFFMANVVGIALTFFFFAYQTLFYLAANKLGAWAPSEVNYSDLLNTRIPWVWVLFIGFLPAVSEEMQFRAFAIPFLRKYLRSGPLALILAAFIWGFLHSAYPNQPFFIRGIEVGVGGIVTGLIMLRFGIVATLIWHYSVDALYTAFLLLRSHNHYLMVSGAVTAGIMLLPLIGALIAYWRSGTFADESGLTNASAGVSRAERKEAVVAAEVPLSYEPLSERRLALAGILMVLFAGLVLLPVERFGEGIKIRVARQDALRAADEFLKQRKVEPANYHRVAWLHENVDPMAVRYLLERKSIGETARIYRQATRLLLWQVRYFRPLEKEEHSVFVTADSGEVFNYLHTVDEDAPLPSLSQDEARALAEKFLVQQGYQLSGFDLQNTSAEKRKARQDYTLTWQAKPGDPRNVGDEQFRLEVDIAGDRVVAFARSFKLPEDWERERSARGLTFWLLLGTFIAGGGALLAGVLILFVKQVRTGEISWRRSAFVGAAFAGVFILSELTGLPTLERAYSTSMTLAAFRIFLIAGILIGALLLGLLIWALVGLAASLFPDSWRVFGGAARRVWRRDAAVATVVSLAAGAGISRLEAFFVTRFHALAPLKVDVAPDGFDLFWPGAAFFLGGVHFVLWLPAVVGVLIYLLRGSSVYRAWWMPMVRAGGVLLLISLGPWSAHSVREYLLGWAMTVVPLCVMGAIVWGFFRDNVLAYLLAAFSVPLAKPLLELLSQPALYFRLNGLLLAVLTLVVLGWMLLGRGETPPA